MVRLSTKDAEWVAKILEEWSRREQAVSTRAMDKARLGRRMAVSIRRKLEEEKRMRLTEKERG